MNTQITIRNVPPAVRDELAARAAVARQSMQEFLLAELERLASRPPVEAWVGRVRERKRVALASLGADEILAQRDEDRH